MNRELFDDKQKNTIPQVQMEHSRTNRKIFGFAVFSIISLNILITFLTHRTVSLLIKQGGTLLVFSLLHIKSLVGGSRAKQEKYFIISAVFANMVPFIFLLSLIVYNYTTRTLLNNQLGMAMIMILATQFLRNKKAFRVILALATSGWLIFLIAVITSTLPTGSSVLNGEDFYRYTHLAGVIILGAYLSLLNTKMLERSKDHSQQLNRTMDFLVQSGNVGLFILDNENDLVKGNANFYRHMGAEIQKGDQSFSQKIIPHLHKEDRSRYYLLRDQMKKGVALTFPVEARVLENNENFRWIRIDGQLLQDEENKRIFMGSTTDIDSLKKSEEEARASAATVQASLLAGKVNIWELDLTTGIFRIGINCFKNKENTSESSGVTTLSFDTFLTNIHPDSRNEVKKQFQAVREGKKNQFSVEYLYYFNIKDTMTWSKDFGVVSSYDEKGRPLKISGYTINIDKEKKDAKRIDRALQTSRFVPWTWNVKEKVGEIDKNYLALLEIPLQKNRFTKEEFFGSMVHPRDLANIKKSFNSLNLREGEFFNQDQSQIFRISFDRGNNYYWMEGQLTGINHNAKGKPTIIEGIVKNITKEREQTRLLKERKKEKELEDTKNRFFSTLSHELRTPMNIIQGMIEMLSKSELDLQQRKNLGKMNEASSFLLNIIDDLLNFSQLSNKKQFLNIEPFSLKSCLQEIHSKFYNKALAGNINLTLTIDNNLPPLLLGDRRKIEQILKKLIENGIKVTPGGKVALSCQLIDQKEDTCQIRFSLSDEGIGIPAEKLAHLFKPFYLADDSDSRRYKGSGLGLAISHQLVEMMNGRMEVESSPGKGSLFTFTIPLKISHSKEEQQERKITYPGSRVLVVDDNPLNREIVVDTLKRAGIKPLTAAGGQDALDLMALEKPELVFMDIQMPEMDGLTAARKQRERERETEGAHIPIVALTANTTDTDRELSFNAGMDGHLVKPLILKKFYHVLDTFLSDYRQIGHKKEINWNQFPPLPGIKMEETLERFAGEYDTLVMMIQDFMSDYREIGATLLELHQLNNQKEIHRRVHALKGVSGSLGIEKIYQISHILTDQYKEKKQVNRDDLLTLIDHIGNFCRQMDLFLIRRDS